LSASADGYRPHPRTGTARTPAHAAADEARRARRHRRRPPRRGPPRGRRRRGSPSTWRCWSSSCASRCRTWSDLTAPATCPRLHTTTDVGIFGFLVARRDVAVQAGLDGQRWRSNI